MSGSRDTLAAAGRAARGGGSVLAVLVVVGVIAALLAGRNGAAAPTASSATPPPVADVGGSAAPGDPATPSLAVASASAVAETPSPAITSDPTPILEPTTDPAPIATPRATPKPTPKPTTKPTHDPAPEPTPAVFKDSGRFGETLSAGGVSAYLEQRAPSPSFTCVSGDPDWQGYTEEVGFTLRMTWSTPSESMEPFVAAGSAPYFYVVSWEWGPFKVGADNVVTVCVRPGDATKALISVESNGGPPRSYRFTFVP